MEKGHYGAFSITLKPPLSRRAGVRQASGKGSSAADKFRRGRESSRRPGVYIPGTVKNTELIGARQ
jgi:hypothetical protein